MRTLLSGYTVRLESRGRESVFVARLIQEAEAKAKPAQFTRQVGMKVPELQGQDQKPVDLTLGRVKSFERGMEARYRCWDSNRSGNPGLGVKS